MILKEYQWNKGNIVCMVFDDDINETVIMLETNLDIYLLKWDLKFASKCQTSSEKECQTDVNKQSRTPYIIE